MAESQFDAKPLLLVDDARFDGHMPPHHGGYHPERPERLLAAREAMAQAALAKSEGGLGVTWKPVDVHEATDDELVRVHSAEYIEILAKIAGKTGYIDPDTYIGEGSVRAAKSAAGALARMTERIWNGDISRGVALLRPPGHHARPSQAMGFCLVNNVAVAAAHARALGAKRVAIVDFDVHHGNGTQEIFWRDPSVLYVSTHQYPFYPGTGAAEERGEGEGLGATVNIPLPAGSGDAEYRDAFERHVLPAVQAFAPEIVLVSAGFDAAASDPLAEMRLSSHAFGWMTRELARAADESANGKIALALEGGYDLTALEEGLGAAIAALVGEPF
ncbi:MAG: histone deacetylase [Polyangiaceae bacterium]